MTAGGFGPDEVRLGEALYRAEGHCLASVELHAAGRTPDAALQAARPIADVLPWLETELRSALAGLRAFTVAVAQLGADVRSGVKPRALRKAFRRVSEARAALLDEAVGPSAVAEEFRVSVGIALLHTLRTTYEEALATENLNVYQSAYGSARMAVELLGDAMDGTSAERDVTVIRAAFPAVEPPEGLWRIDAVTAAVDAIAAAATGAVSPEPSLSDSLDKVDKLLGDVARSYDEEMPALAARLAASLFVRTYDPVRAGLESHDRDAAEELTRILGVDLRRAINAVAAKEEVAALVATAREIVARARPGDPTHTA
jgi:hypothetical protein